MDPESSQYELFVELFARNEGNLKAFVRSMLPTWHDADEVVQQVALVAWRKFDQFDPQSSFIKWVCVIARFEALAYRRKMARDRLVFSEDLISLMAEEGTEEMPQRHAENKALEKCLQKLPNKQREFVTLAYTPGITAKSISDKEGVRPGSFYMRLNRIRKQLLVCIQKTIQEEEGLA